MGHTIILNKPVFLRKATSEPMEIFPIHKLVPPDAVIKVVEKKGLLLFGFKRRNCYYYNIAWSNNNFVNKDKK